MAKLWASYGNALQLILTGSTTKTLTPAHQEIFINMLAEGMHDDSGEAKNERRLPGVWTEKHYTDEARQEYETMYYIPGLFRYMQGKYTEWSFFPPPVDLDYLNSLRDELGEPLFMFSNAPSHKAWEESSEGQKRWELFWRKFQIQKNIEEIDRTYHGGDPLKLEAQKRMRSELDNELSEVSNKLMEFSFSQNSSQETAMEIGTPEWRRQNAINAANAKHNKPGGSRDKQQEIRDLWATGKYSSRDRCAEEEYDALGMSFSAARKALRNTPNPKSP